MSFYEDFLVEFGRESIFFLIQKLGILVKWIFYLGRKPLSEIKTENWNTRIGLVVFSLLIGFIIYFVN